MEIQSFAEQVRSQMGNELDSSQDIRIHRVNKNNGVYYTHWQMETAIIYFAVNKNNGVYYTGLQITENGLNISPIIYIDRYYGLYEKGGETVESTAAFVMDTYNRERSGSIMQVDMGKFLSYDSIRESIVYRLVNTEKNRELLEDIPHMEYMDLSIVFQCIISQEELGTASILIHNVHMKLWDVTVGELYEAAEKNTPELMPYEIKTMADVLCEIMEAENPEEFDDEDYRAGLSESVPMYVLSNRNRVEGAACMLYPDLLRDFADAIGSSLYIIPSSTHELLLLPTEYDGESAEIKLMIRKINDTQVSEEEILSYSLYYYDREEGKITML